MWQIYSEITFDLRSVGVFPFAGYGWVSYKLVTCKLLFKILLFAELCQGSSRLLQRKTDKEQELVQTLTNIFRIG